MRVTTEPSKPRFGAKEIAFVAVPLLFVASLWVVPESLFLVAYASGRAGACPLKQTVFVRQAVNELNRTTAEIASQSTVELKEPNGGLWRWNTPYGIFFAPPETSVPFLLSEQATRIYGDGSRRVRKDDVVLDCGANVGAFTREALNAGAKLVIAIEPSARNIEALRRTFAQEIEQERVIVYPKGIWDRDGMLKFYVYENSALDSFVLAQRVEENKKPREETVAVETIDRIVDELKLKRIDFIKMDVEGAERNAVEGAQQTLAKFHPRMAIALENLPDDQYVVPPLVEKAWSGYRQECGRCTLAPNGLVQPDVMFFY